MTFAPPSWLALAVALLGAVGVGAAPEIPFQDDYDVAGDFGTLAVPGPDQRPVVIRRRAGLQVLDVLPLEGPSTRGTLVLWVGYPTGRWVYPELWLQRGEAQVQRVWPSNPHLEWEDAEVHVETVEGETRAVVTRHVPTTRLGAPSVRTREVLALGPTGLELADKRYSRWSAPEQFLAVAADLLATGQGAEVPDLVAAYQDRQGPLGADTHEKLEALLTGYLLRVEGRRVKTEDE